MRLGVNIDHVATVRQARLAAEPEPVAAAVLAELAGAHGITVHLRGDRRHIQERDLDLLRQVVATKLNLEMAATPEMIDVAARVRPHQVTLVPEQPEELTTTGGLDVVRHRAALRIVVQSVRRAGIRTSLFIDADIAQVQQSAEVGADAIEINTGPYADGRRRRAPGAARTGCRSGRGRRQARPRGAGRTRADVPERRADRGDRRDRGVEHRPQHRRARRAGRHGTGGARDARAAADATVTGGWVIQIQPPPAAIIVP